MVAVDGFAVFVMTVVLVATLLALLLSAGLPRPRTARGARVLRADALLRDRHDADGVGERPRHRLPLARDPVDRARTCSPRSTGAGSRRRRPASSTSCSARSRPRSSSTASRSRTARPARRTSRSIAQFLATTTLLDDGVLLARLRAPARRARVQGRGRAVPHVDARRVPGRAHAGDRVHGRRDEGRRVRARCCASSSARSTCTASTGGRRSAALAVLSLLVGIDRRARADRREAHARVLVDQPRGLHPDRRAGRDRRGHERRALLPARLRGDGLRRVRGRHGGRRAAATTTTRSRLPRPRRSPARAGRAARPCSCSRRPAFRSPAASWRSSSVFDAAVDARQYWLALIGMLDRGRSARSSTCASCSTMYAPSDEDDDRRWRRAGRLDPGAGMALTIAASAIIVPGRRAGLSARLRPRRHATARDVTHPLSPELRRTR